MVSGVYPMKKKQWEPETRLGWVREYEEGTLGVAMHSEKMDYPDGSKSIKARIIREKDWQKIKKLLARKTPKRTP